ncbi:MAG: phenylalanine--tRNA ligase subunit beta [Candidatus Heimdallarchaeota archaeon]|nr:MAG: phenylalanine--tRNA ligase subunit beta [Candidatus Heimdallarchaeota archaeon]
MVAFKISYYDVIELLNLPDDTTIEELDNLFSFAKSEIEEHDLADEGYIKVDCKTSNRPDLWGVEGLVREVSGAMGLHINLPEISAEPSGFVIEVDPRLKTIRPYIACSIIRGVKFSDFLIKQLIQLQEKVDFSYGRRRSRSSIGIYNVNMLESPILYELTPRTTSFYPLGYTKKMTLDEILARHEKGVEYCHILPSKGDLPILRDVNGVVLSMPPIINSNDVGRVNEETTDVLVEVTGTNLEVVKVVNTLITQAIRDRGGKVYSVEIHYPENHGDAPTTLVTPETEPFEIIVNSENIKGYLGLDLTVEKIIELLKKRRFDATEQNGLIKVKYPPYRVDLLHWVDVAEEVAIAYGYMNIEPAGSEVPTIGNLSSRTISENYVREILSGCSLQEVLSFSLTDPEKLSTLMGYKSDIISSFVQVANPVSSTYSVMRNRLFPGLLDFLSRNTHNEYPQYLFEVGEVVKLEKNSVKTISKTAVIMAGTEVSFEHCHSILETLIQGLGVRYELEVIESSEFISGRTAKIKVDGKEVGIIGEISPTLLENWELFVPAAAFELDLSSISTLSLPPVEI